MGGQVTAEAAPALRLCGAAPSSPRSWRRWRADDFLADAADRPARCEAIRLR
jgi:hypothetical protein